MTTLTEREKELVAACRDMLIELDDDAEPGEVACWCDMGVKCTACRMRETVLKADPEALNIERCSVCNTQYVEVHVFGVPYCSHHEPRELADLAMERWEQQRKLQEV